MKKFHATIEGNDTFYVNITVTASNIELALAEALKQLDSYTKLTIEQLRVTSIGERP